MQMPLCSRCKKNVAVVFISQMNSDPSKNQGYCLKCARELGIGPINGLMQQMGLTDEDIDQMSSSMTDFSQYMPDVDDQAIALSEEPDEDGDDKSDDDIGRTRSFPFLEKMFRGGLGDSVDASAPKKTEDGKKDKKRKNLNAYCTDLTARAREGKLDNIVGRDSETQRVIQILGRRQKNNP